MGPDADWAAGMANPNANMHGFVSFGATGDGAPPFVVRLFDLFFWIFTIVMSSLNAFIFRSMVYKTIL
jgi:hypothetical protein